MLIDKNIKKISCYSVLQAGISGESHLHPHMRLVLFLIYQKKYTYIDIKQLVTDFKNDFHYEIQFFAMNRILSIAVASGYLKKNELFQYIPTPKIDEMQAVEAEISFATNQFNRILEEFRRFAKQIDKSKEYSFKLAKDVLVQYIDSQKLEHISGHIEGIMNNKTIDHLFGRFVFHLKDNDIILFDALTRMVTGSILKDYLTYDNILESDSTLKDLTVLIDTDVAFLLLGIDIVENRQKYYIELVKSLQAKGAKIMMLRHTYDEMQQIILGSQCWMQNGLFDVRQATSACKYFYKKAFTSNDVILVSAQLKKNLSEAPYNIDILDFEYDKEKYPFHPDEKEIYTMIRDLYQIRPSFNEDEKRRTMEIDARSISQVYMLRGSRLPIQIADANYLFVTTNHTISKVAFEYEKKNRANGVQFLPTVVTDVFLGTFLWLSDPVKIHDMNQQQIIAHAYLAFQPGPEMVKKLCEAIEDLQNKGELSDEIAYIVKSSQMVQDRISQKSLGDPEAFLLKHITEVLKDIEDEAKQKGRNEILAEINELVIKHDAEIALKNKHFTQALQDERSKRVLMTRMLLDIKKRELKEFEAKHEKAKRYKSTLEKNTRLVLVISSLITVILIICLWLLGNRNKNEYLGPVSMILAVIIWFVTLYLNFKKGVDTQPSDLLKEYIIRKCDKYSLKLNYSEKEHHTIKQEISDLESSIELQ